VARENDHQLVTDPGHTLANGDRFVVDAVTGEGLFVRRVLEDEQLAERQVLYPAAKASLWHMRDTYKAETEWAPPHVGRQLRGVRLAAEDARQLAIRSRAEAQAASDPETRDRHSRVAASAEVRTTGAGSGGRWRAGRVRQPRLRLPPGRRRAAGRRRGGGHNDRGLRGQTWMGPTQRLVTRRSPTG